MIIIKSRQELELMREAGKVTGYILKELEQFMKPGVATIEIDRYVEKTVKEYGMTAADIADSISLAMRYCNEL